MAPRNRRTVSHETRSSDTVCANDTMATENNAAKSSSSDILPDYLQTLLEGTGVSVRDNLKYPFEKPDWLDMDRVRRGQEFAKAHIFGMMNAIGMSVLLVSAYQTIMQPIIFSGKSSTPYTAYRRYLDTVSYVKSWYEGDIWEESTKAHKNMKTVRGMHDRIQKKITSAPKEEVDQKTSLEGIPMWTTLHNEMQEDFKESCPMLTTPIRGEKLVYVNQADLAIAQFSFLGLAVMYPKMFGIHNVSDEILSDFIHLWRAIGFLLGVEDRYNLCDVDDVATVRQRGHQLLDFWLKPLLRQGSKVWVHMGRCMITGIGMYVPGTSFEVSMLYLCRVLDIKTPRLKAALDFWQRMAYNSLMILFGVLLRWTPMWKFVNWMLNKSLSKAQNMSEENLEKLKGRVYGYE